MTFDIEDTKARKEARVAALRADAEAKRAEIVAAWRAVDPSARTCSDGIAITLAELETEFGGKR